MGFAVELYFDTGLEAAIRALRVELGNAGIPPFMDEIGDRPHVSLAVFSELDVPTLTPLLAAFAAETPEFTISFASVGVFPTAEGAVFLAPLMTDQLKTIHQDFHRRLGVLPTPSGAYYRPDQWVPHCTLAMEVPQPLIGTAVQTCVTHWQSYQGVVQEVGLIEFRPVKTWQLYPLRGV